MTHYQLFDTVRTLEPICLAGKMLPAGAIGVVVEIFQQPYGLMIEFAEDKELILPVLQAQQVEPIKTNR